MRSPRRAEPSALGRALPGGSAPFPQLEVTFRIDHVLDPHDHVTSKYPSQARFVESVLSGIGRYGRTIRRKGGTDLLGMRVLKFGGPQLIKRTLRHPMRAVPGHGTGCTEVRRRLAGSSRAKTRIGHGHLCYLVRCPKRACIGEMAGILRMSNLYEHPPEHFPRHPTIRRSPVRRSALRRPGMSAVSPPAVQRVIDNYVAKIPAAHWTEIETFVRASVTSLGLQTRGVARNYLAATAKFAHWLWQTAAANLDPAAAFRPALIRRFVHEVMPARAETYQQQTAQRLNTLVAHFTAATPDRQTRKNPASAHPYASRDLITFRSSAARRTNVERRMNAHVLLALGAGAGMRAEEIALARISDVTTDGDELLVSVRGNHPRTVPLRVEWRRALATGINGREPGEWLFAGYRLPEYPARVIHQFGIDAPDEPTPSATRLRATWIVRHLNAGLRLDILLELAGLATPTSLAPYVQAMTPYDMVDVRHLISGAEPTR
ncbi:hypothetical protein E3T24_05890 [Cryobacterium sp. TmT2-59]|nr:hypothetical protein E3T24_05890 [Cryobacterium sp. TmT2-59]TFD18550.1 hypothetical protein E3T32_12080 [Cryobacterium sp. TMT2-23]